MPGIGHYRLTPFSRIYREASKQKFCAKTRGGDKKLASGKETCFGIGYNTEDMKIITLNTWGGRAGKEGLLDFFKNHADTDVFCLQEIWAAPYEEWEGKLAGGRKLKNDQTMVYALREISEMLPNHESYFRPHFLENYGLLMFVKKDIKVLEEGEFFVHKEKGYVPEDDIGNHARNIQYVTLETTSGPMTIINFHGLWAGKGVGKIDTPDRLSQSKKISDFISEHKEKVVFCGDFNLLPDTESLMMLERAGLKRY